MDNFTVPCGRTADDKMLLATIILSDALRPGDLGRLARVLLLIAPLAEETLDPDPVAVLETAVEDL